MKKCAATVLLISLLLTDFCLAQYWLSEIPQPDSASRAKEVLSAPTTEIFIERDPFWVSDGSGLFATGMIWRDCNLDGFIDLFISNGNDMAIAPNAIYISDAGSLPTTASWHSDNSAYTGHCAVGDIDDNGYPDFLVANFLGDGRFSTPNRSDLYLNFTGIPSTSPGWQTQDSMKSFSCALGDPDGDGDLDAAFATGTAYIDEYTPDRIYFNNGGTLETLPGWTSTPQTAGMDVTWGDVDNDGDLDLAFCYDYQGAAVYYNNEGVIETSPSWHSADVQSANTIIFGDINNDGWLDLVVAYNSQLSGGGYYRAYYNDGTGNLNSAAGWQSATGGYGSALALYDYDNDGDDDLAAGRWWDCVRLYENIGGTFTSSPVWQANPSTVVEEVAWVDVDSHAVGEFADTFRVADTRKLFYTSRHPLYSVDSVLIDGVIIGDPDYCFDLISGWISLGQSPEDSAVVYYKYSVANDLAISNWDTSNLIFQNLLLHARFYSDIDSGWAPLEVQFTDSSIGATQWEWDFGDGEGSTERHPSHVFENGGGYDVSLRVLFEDGWRERTVSNMIRVIADTIRGDIVYGSPGSSVEVCVRLRNNFPVDFVKLPVEFGGALPLTYDSFSTVGCRTDYFANQDYAHADFWFNKCFTVRLKTATDGSQQPMPPGDGDLIKLYFTVSPGASTYESTSILFDGYLSGSTTYLPMLYGSIIDVQAATMSGAVTWSCCDGIRGNLDGDIDQQVTIEDVQYFIDWTFSHEQQPSCRDEADVDGSGRVDIEDIVYLVDYVFGDGSSPVGCF